MKCPVYALPLATLLRVARQATMDAAADAVAAGRAVAGWKDGRVIEYGRGALPRLWPIMLTARLCVGGGWSLPYTRTSVAG